LRTLLITFLLTLLSFALSLFLGILGTLAASRLRGQAPDLSFAYRHVAVPVAIGVAAVVLIASLVLEVRHYRQAKALAEIERGS